MWILEFDLVNDFDTKVQVYRFVAQDVLKLLGNAIPTILLRRPSGRICANPV
jgi:hypothetical protein